MVIVRPVRWIPFGGGRRLALIVVVIGAQFLVRPIGIFLGLGSLALLVVVVVAGKLRSEVRIEPGTVTVRNGLLRAQSHPRSQIAMLRVATIGTRPLASSAVILGLRGDESCVFVVGSAFDPNQVARALDVPVHGTFDDGLTWEEAESNYAGLGPLRRRNVQFRMAAGVVALIVGGLIGWSISAHSG